MKILFFTRRVVSLSLLFFHFMHIHTFSFFSCLPCIIYSLSFSGTNSKLKLYSLSPCMFSTLFGFSPLRVLAFTDVCVCMFLIIGFLREANNASYFVWRIVPQKENNEVMRVSVRCISRQRNNTQPNTHNTYTRNILEVRKSFRALFPASQLYWYFRRISNGDWREGYLSIRSSSITLLTYTVSLPSSLPSSLFISSTLETLRSEQILEKIYRRVTPCVVASKRITANLSSEYIYEAWDLDTRTLARTRLSLYRLLFTCTHSCLSLFASVLLLLSHFDSPQQSSWIFCRWSTPTCPCQTCAILVRYMYRVWAWEKRERELWVERASFACMCHLRIPHVLHIYCVKAVRMQTVVCASCTVKPVQCMSAWLNKHNTQ